jgi:hypothetical protein
MRYGINFVFATTTATNVLPVKLVLLTLLRGTSG